jgi:hypothetical protein
MIVNNTNTCINGHTVIDADEDACVWSLSNDGVFSVGDTRRHIDNLLLPSLDLKTIWDKVLPRKVNIFLWRLRLDRLPHRLNLSVKGIEIHTISCPSCNNNVESCQLVFFECEVALSIWRLVRVWCDPSMPLFISNSHWKDWLNS